MGKFTIKQQLQLKKQDKKGCQGCGVIKHTDEFYHLKNGRIRSKCKECDKSTQKQARKDNPEIFSQRWKRWRDNNVEHRKEYNKKYREENKEHRKALRKEYYEKNRESQIQYSMDNYKRRMETDNLFRVKEMYRAVLRSGFRRKGWSKNTKTQEVLGCSFEEFQSHIELQFTEGMTWDNHGIGNGHWNLDHIIPISTAESEEDIIKLNHYTNFQPLWWEDNIEKSDKISEEWGNVLVD